ncbi:MAG: L,D-transpeptidase family protein [Candidatus Omnitrophica bacterium]|nr:L,D-transpeptidase family protein [Candidatus Omnitrophota bacterium]
MRRRIVIGVVVTGGVALGTGLAVWASTQGLLGPNGRAKRLLNLAHLAMERGDVSLAQRKLEELVGTLPDSPLADQGLFQLGQLYEQRKQLLEARTAYRTLMEHFPNSPLLADTQKQLGQANVSLLFSPTVTEQDVLYEVKPGDSLGKIATSSHTTVELLKRANGLSGDTIRPQQKLKVSKSTFRIVVDKSQNRLLLTADNQFFKLYPVATGHDNSTPVGTFKILNKVPNPVWYRQGAVVPPDSPENILGTRWLGLEKTGYGIHGSVDPSGIGQQVTAGCVRMHNPDVEEVFAIVPIGTEVSIVD